MKLISFRMGLVTLLACGVIAIFSSPAVAQDAAGNIQSEVRHVPWRRRQGRQNGYPRFRIARSEGGK